MIAFIYDKTFEGLLTAVFDAYVRKSFPDVLLAEGEPLPLFCEETVTICSDKQKADRVWKGLEKKISKLSLSGLTVSWLSELPEIQSRQGMENCMLTIKGQKKIMLSEELIAKI